MSPPASKVGTAAGFEQTLTTLRVAVALFTRAVRPEQAWWGPGSGYGGAWVGDSEVTIACAGER